MIIPVSDSAPSSDSDFLPSRSTRNLKKLSISSTSSLIQDIPIPTQRHRRPSVASLPALRHRKDEELSPTVPYLDGPTQIIPGIWLGSEDNARDWKGLIERGIRSILNVAKEVVSPFDSAKPVKPFASTPNLKDLSKNTTSTYYPAHLPSGRPSMHYLKLQWSHGQQDLVRDDFPIAMAFTDAALERGEGVLIQYVFILFFFRYLLIPFQLSMRYFSLSDYGHCSCYASCRSIFTISPSRSVGFERHACRLCICKREKSVGRT